MGDMAYNMNQMNIKEQPGAELDDVSCAEPGAEPCIEPGAGMDACTGAEPMAWPETWTVNLSRELPEVRLPLVVSPTGFGIYAFNMMGQMKWNVECAAIFREMLLESGVQFDIFLTAEAKAIGLTEELARLYSHEEYIVLRKSKKLYMSDPVELSVKSITTPEPQKFFLGRESYNLLRGKRVVAVDDVISTGGTMHAFFELTRQIGFTIVTIASVLTEETKWTEYESTPVISIGHIPLPGQIK